MDPQATFDELTAHGIPWGIAIVLVVVFILFRVPGAVNFVRVVLRHRRERIEVDNVRTALNMAHDFQAAEARLRSEFKLELDECRAGHRRCEEELKLTKTSLQTQITSLNVQVTALAEAAARNADLIIQRDIGSAAL